MSEILPLGDLVDQVTVGLPHGVSHLLFGAMGGALYIVRLLAKGYGVLTPWEWFARPIFGAVAAYALTVSFGLPNHLTSVFVGYFGVDIWDALATRFGDKLPLAFKHTKREELDKAIQARVDELEKK